MKVGKEMIEVRPIKQMTLNQLKNMGFNGYRTHTILEVTQDNEGMNQSFRLEKVSLDDLYIKEWRTSSDALNFFNEIVDQGYSLAAFVDDVVVGIAIMSYIDWNNSVWIENFRVSEAFMGQGIGRLLIEAPIKVALNKGARIIGLETQSTNYPAIRFYQKCGFEISGVDLYRYPQRENDLKQVGVLMAIEL